MSRPAATASRSTRRSTSAVRSTGRASGRGQRGRGIEELLRVPAQPGPSLRPSAANCPRRPRPLRRGQPPRRPRRAWSTRRSAARGPAAREAPHRRPQADTPPWRHPRRPAPNPQLLCVRFTVSSRAPRRRPDRHGDRAPGSRHYRLQRSGAWLTRRRRGVAARVPDAEAAPVRPVSFGRDDATGRRCRERGPRPRRRGTSAVRREPVPRGGEAV